jgi:hypothetical protein
MSNPEERRQTTNDHERSILLSAMRQYHQFVLNPLAGLELPEFYPNTCQSLALEIGNVSI